MTNIKSVFYVIYPTPIEILENFENVGFFWKISNYNFQSRRQIMTAREVYSIKFCPTVGYGQDMVLIFLFALKGDP